MGKEKKEKSISRFLASRSVTLVISLLLALITWFLVANTVNNEIRREIVEIPIDLNEQIETLANMGLRLTSYESATATVSVYGSRGLVGGLTTEDLSVTASLTGISGAGEYDLRLVSAKTDASSDFQIMNVSPATISVSIERQSSQTFTPVASMSSVNIPSGYMMEQSFLSPTEVTITGSMENLAKIDRVAVEFELEEPLTRTTVLDGSIVLYDDQERVLPQDNFILSTQTVSVTVPVLKLKTLDLTIDFINEPEGVDAASLPYIMSTSFIDVAGPADEIDTFNEIHLGYIDLHKLTPGATFNFDIKLPKGFRNIKNINSTIVRFSLEDYASVLLETDNINLINEPANYQLEVLTESITDVELIGPVDEIAELTGAEVVAELDVSQHELSTGQYNLPVRIIIPTRTGVWAVGEYTVVFNVKQK